MDELKEIFDQAKVINQLDTQTGNLIYCYDIFMFLLGEKSNNCKFSEFCKYYNMADGTLARAGGPILASPGATRRQSLA